MKLELIICLKLVPNIVCGVLRLIIDCYEVFNSFTLYMSVLISLKLTSKKNIKTYLNPCDSKT